MTEQRDSAERRARKFGHLRSLVHGPQTPGSWLSVCALLGSWPQEELEEVLAYAAHGLSGWPASIRVMPSKPKVLDCWIARPKLWRLIGALRLTWPSELERYMSGDWSGLEQLSVLIRSDDSSWIELLKRWDGFNRVTSLELEVHDYGGDFAPLIKTLAQLPWRLDALSIHALTASCKGVLDAVWSGAWVKGLQRLELSVSASLISSVYEAMKRGAFSELKIFRVHSGTSFQAPGGALDAPIWRGLEEFSHSISDGWLALDALSRAGATPRVLALHLGANIARPSLLSAAMLQRLETVTLSYAPSLAEVLNPMIEHARALRTLKLQSCHLMGAPAPSLWGLAQLEELSWSSIQADASWSEWFATQGVISRLNRLHLFHQSLPAEMISPMIKALYEEGEPLRSLLLTGCDLGVQQLFKIVDSGRLDQCEQLVLSNNRFQAQDRKVLLDLFLADERLAALKQLSIAGSYNMFSQDDVRLLRARFSRLVV